MAAEGLLYLAEGRAAEAVDVIAQAGEVGLQRNVITRRLLLQGESELGLALGNYQSVVSLTERVIDEMRAEGGRLWLCHALAYRGRALLGLGDLENARASLLEAGALAEASGLRAVLWRILAALAKLEARGGHPAESQGLRAELRSIIDDLAGRTGTPERRAGFLATLAVQAALTA